MMTRATHYCGVEFLALGSPGKLDASKCRTAAALAINWRLAVEGRVHPAGEVVLGFGSAAEAEAAILRARGEAAGGICAVMYAPAPRDAVLVERLGEISERGRAAFAAGVRASAEPFPVFIGTRTACEIEATRWRRVRAGHRSGGKPS